MKISGKVVKIDGDEVVMEISIGGVTKIIRKNLADTYPDPTEREKVKLELINGGKQA